MSIIYINSYQFAAAPVGNLWTPSQLTTALWLDANDGATITESGGAVTSWSDKSGNSATAVTTGNPTYSLTGLSTSKPAVQLDGTGDYLISSIANLFTFNALDIYMVMQTTNAATANVDSGFFWGIGNCNNGSAPYPATQGYALTSSTGLLSGETITYTIDRNTVGRLGSNAYARAANTAQIMGSRMSTAGTQLYANGSQISLNLASGVNSSTNTAPSALSYAVDNDFIMGGFRINGGILASLPLKFAEIVVTSSLLDTGNRQKMEGYLAHKWGLAASLPAAHPYKSAAPTV